VKIEAEGTQHRGRPRKTLWDCVKADMESFGLSRENAQDMDHWRLRVKRKRLTKVYLESGLLLLLLRKNMFKVT